MCDRVGRAIWVLLVGLTLPPSLASLSTVWAEEEPPAINPFGPVRQERDDAVPGYLEMSDGTVYAGNLYLTRDKRLKLEDRQAGGDDVRQREVPLRAVKKIECNVQKEWMEKEWRFKEAALNEKVYTGRSYPARVYTYTVTLKDGRKLTGSLGEIIYVQPLLSPEGPRAEQSASEAKRFLLHKRDKGEIGTDLKSLLYVREIRLGKEALEEGQKRAKSEAKAGKKGKKVVEEAAEVENGKEEGPRTNDE